MKPHNSERQAALKRKREDAEEEAHARVVRARTESDEKRSKRPGVKAQKAKERPKQTRKCPRPKQKVPVRHEPQSPTETSRPAVSLERDDTAPVAAQNAENVQETAQLEDMDQGENYTAGAAPESPAQSRTETFLAVLVSNVAADRIARRQAQESNYWSQTKEHFSSGPGGVKELNKLARENEYLECDNNEVRTNRGYARLGIRMATKAFERSEAASRDLSELLLKRKSQLYDFADLPREVPHLDCLTDQFWTTFDNCQAVNTEQKGIELKLRGVEQDQEEQLKRIDAYSTRAVRDMYGARAEATASPPAIAHENAKEVLEGCSAALTQLWHRKEELLELSGQARDLHGKFESELNSIADNLLVKRGLLHAEFEDDGPAEDQRNSAAPISGSRDNPGSEARVGVEPTEKPDEPEEGAQMTQNHRSSMNPIDEARNSLQAEMQPGGEPIETSSGPDEIVQSNQRNMGRPEGEGGIEGSPNHQGKTPLTEAALAAFLADVDEARDKLAECEDNLVEARERVPSDARSMDSDQQGAAMASNLLKRTRAFIEAEEDYRDVLHEAQNARAIVNSPCQSSNFQRLDGESDHDLSGGEEYPLPEPKRRKIQIWKGAATGDDQQVSMPNLRLDAKMNWNGMPEPGFGEDVEFTSFGRNQQRLNREFDFQEKLRRDGPWSSAENDTHPKNRYAGIVPGFSLPWSWADVSRPTKPAEDGYPSQIRREIPGRTGETGSDGPNPDETEPNEPNAGELDPIEAHDEGRTPGSKNAQMPIYDPDAPMVDYAIEGYDGLNMDGIE